ncbi:hypothetical protein [Engelhardtia mirabilis]|uniref:SGNH hydrolase-type esterase domain-containing protein n=1 Tax=Engelhardtia mirabilis TaxID=2528011 RepID=A0A518BRW1_9BACT|nr:hypothetical protein Pla133_48330 [Planctomycetes bacterium Pla133]QDV04038.1 hypothetical protein Pla86_48310 [Planctomycetes bacterium Pla86]
MKLAQYAVIFWTLGLLAAAELALEYRAHARGWETLLFGGPTYSELPVDSPFGPTPDYPFRSRIVPREKPPGVLRIWVASASYGEHIFLPADQIFPVVLEDELRERGFEVQVLNASRASLTARAAVRDLELVAPAWQPDVALMYHLSNDLDGLTARMLAVRADEDAEVVIASERAETLAPTAEAAHHEGQAPWPTRQARRTTLYEQAKNQIGARLTPARMLRDQVPDEVADVFEARAADFIDAARALGAVPVLVTFATSHPPGDPDLFPAGYRRNLYRHNGVLSVAGWRAGAADWNRRLARLGASSGTTVVDLAAAVAGHSEFFIDFVHFTPAGHAQVARTLADALAPVLEELRAR